MSETVLYEGKLVPSKLTADRVRDWCDHYKFPLPHGYESWAEMSDEVLAEETAALEEGFVLVDGVWYHHQTAKHEDLDNYRKVSKFLDGMVLYTTIFHTGATCLQEEITEMVLEHKP